MGSTAIRHGAAVDERVSISATAGLDNDVADASIVETSIPARLDSLRWGGFHTRVVAALGITWIARRCNFLISMSASPTAPILRAR
jgi:hypothetical protein